MTRVHHLRCGTMCPLGGCLVSGEGSLFSAASLVCHCLLVARPDGLVLVDTGLGVADLAAARASLRPQFKIYARPRFDAEVSALRGIERAGFRAADVRHVLLTHLDLDHAGGLADFPRAEVHLLDAELEAARGPRAPWRYQPAQWSHGPRWRPHAAHAQRWFGFDAVAPFGGDDDVLLVSLPGHTRGHAGVAVRDGRGWLLHAGDAYFHRAQVASVDGRAPLGLAVTERWLDEDPSARRAAANRLAELVWRHPEVRVVCSHDPVELATCVAASRGRWERNRAPAGVVVVS